MTFNRYIVHYNIETIFYGGRRSLIYAEYDATRGAFSTIPIPIWESAYEHTRKCLQIKDENPDAIFLTEASMEEVITTFSFVHICYIVIKTRFNVSIVLK